MSRTLSEKEIIDLAQSFVEHWESIKGMATEFQERFGVSDACKEAMIDSMRKAAGGLEVYEASKQLLLSLKEQSDKE